MAKLSVKTRIVVYLDPQDKLAISRAAKLQGKSVSDYAATVLAQAAKKGARE